MYIKYIFPQIKMKITKYDNGERFRGNQKGKVININTSLYWKTQMKLEHVKHIKWQR